MDGERRVLHETCVHRYPDDAINDAERWLSAKATSGTRKAFTLIEVIIAILIIGVLVALLLPAVNAAMRAGKRASVVAEMTMFSQGIAAFAGQAQSIPPSRFICSETGDYSTATLTASGPLRDEIAMGSFGVPWASLSAPQQAAATTTIDRQATRTINDLKAIWPGAPASKSGPPPVIPGIGFLDFNGDGVANPPYLLTGDECLVFFLGGIPKPFPTPGGITSFGMIGIAIPAAISYARNPFLPDAYKDPKTGAVVVPARRLASVEFASSRLVDLDGDGMPSYADSYSGYAFPTPYAYFAASGGNYDPDDCNFVNEPDGTPSPRGGYAGLGLGIAGYVASPAPNPYTIGSPIPTVGADYSQATLDANAAAYIPSWANPSSYQIISAGQDRQFGPGGWWYAGATTSTKLPFSPAANAAATGVLLTPDARVVERDNLATFAGGPLD